VFKVLVVGVQVHCPEKLGEDPVVALLIHFAIRLPLLMKVNLPATSTDTVIVTAMPFFAVPEREGVPIFATSATFVIVMK
jgi:hypothetical protein